MAITLEAIPGGATTTRTPLEEIDADVKEAVEDGLKYCLDAPAERLQAKFATQDKANDFLREARAYAYQRPEGRVTVSGNTTKSGYVRFRVAVYVGAETEDGSEAEVTP